MEPGVIGLRVFDTRLVKSQFWFLLHRSNRDTRNHSAIWLDSMKILQSYRFQQDIYLAVPCTDILVANCNRKMQKVVSCTTVELMQKLGSDLSDLIHFSIKASLIRFVSSELPPTCHETETFPVSY